MKPYFKQLARSICDDSFELLLDNEFVILPTINPDIIEAACLAGFMPMGLPPGIIPEINTPLLAKLHLMRALLDPASVHMSKTARKNAKKYWLTINTNFTQVLEQCQAIHGKDWLTDTLAASFIQLHKERENRDVEFISFELFKNKTEIETVIESAPQPDRSTIVAGELGYRIGACYASLSGFTQESGAGTVQMVLMARYLASCGVRLWDLGMPLAYKDNLGARNIERKKFVRILQMAYAHNKVV